MRLAVYGDFNSPLSYLASARVDRILEQGLAEVEWRAIEHDPRIAPSGQHVDAELGIVIRGEVDAVRHRLRPGESLDIRVPPYRSNTAAAVAAFATAPAAAADDARRRLFHAVWSEGRNISQPAAVRELTGIATSGRPTLAAHWQGCWFGLDQPVVPTLQIHTGYVARGFVALACLGLLAFDGSLPRRPWAEFRQRALTGPVAVRAAPQNSRLEVAG